MDGNRLSIRRNARRTRRALSLLELVLALSISVVVLGLMSMAIRFQMHTFEKRRDRIEEAQLARAILRSIADDLRSAVAHRPIDLQGVSAVTGNAMQSAGGMLGGSVGGSGGPGASGQNGSGQNGGGSSSNNPSNNASPMGNASAGNGSSSGNNGAGGNNGSAGNGGSRTGGGGGGASSGGSSSNSASGSTSATGEEEGAASTAGAVAGLYGDQYTLTFDISRLPRLDEYQSIVSENAQEAVAQIPTDVRTVSYYLEGSTPTMAGMSQTLLPGAPRPLSPNDPSLQDPTAPPEGKGLVRQERDRSVASYSSTTVDLSNVVQDTGEELLAEEVTRLEFRYFDGYEWWPDWDSDVRGGLPMAVEIMIGMADRKTNPNAAASTSSALSSTAASNVPQELFYRLVVRIPTAEPLDSTAMETAEEDMAAGDAASDANASTTSAPMSGGS